MLYDEVAGPVTTREVVGQFAEQEDAFRAVQEVRLRGQQEAEANVERGTSAGAGLTPTRTRSIG